MKKINIVLFSIIIFNFVFFSMNLYSQNPSCTPYCSNGQRTTWDDLVYTTVITFDIPPNSTCQIKVYYKKAANCPPSGYGCSISIFRIEPLSAGCPIGWTIKEYLDFAVFQLLKNQLPGFENNTCFPTSQNQQTLFNVYYPSPCWKWGGIINPYGPPPALIPCDNAYGCCFSTYLLTYNDNDFGNYNVVLSSRQIFGICPEDPNCFNVCE